jgi:hypothetical protein
MYRNSVKMMLVCAILAALPAARGQDGGKRSPARFALGNSKSVDSHVAEVKVEVDRELLDNKDIWLGVIPVQAPGSVWLQGTPVVTLEAERVVYLGLENVPTNAKFQVVILACPRGTFEKDGEVRVRELTRLKVEILASHTIHRTK